MDEEWARSVLDRWIGLVNSAMGDRQVFAVPGPSLDALLAVEDQTKRVVQRVLQLPEAPALVVYAGKHYYDLKQGRQTVQYSLGRLATEAETRAQLGSSSPRMAADALHPLVWGSAAALWSDGHYAAAVQRAATFVNADVQARVARHDVSDVALMNQVFGEGAASAGSPRLKWRGPDDDLTVKAMRSGLRQFAAGCFLAIRNPRTHSTDELPRQDAFEQLAALSMLVRWIDVCDVVRG
ncbi:MULTISPECIES: TIGR02391 family protein [unclassified Rathayibacter]|uniref:TIGR02391 family protein n=1 Tax=unclassified Rathayibacter TaxID=2609250 RepID=UPI000CE8F282|nr:MULTISPECIES: TIGR02391 family protein [unclassified Rathayibacter]PPI39251.1 hypothetical protein C5D50_08795 [Rathayibacter sp. RFBD1]PPI57285.1 hypothetical protein C5D38_08375 [Rathayibacter sp. TRS19]